MPLATLNAVGAGVGVAVRSGTTVGAVVAGAALDSAATWLVGAAVAFAALGTGVFFGLTMPATMTIPTRAMIACVLLERALHQAFKAARR